MTRTVQITCDGLVGEEQTPHLAAAGEDCWMAGWTAHYVTEDLEALRFRRVDLCPTCTAETRLKEVAR